MITFYSIGQMRPIFRVKFKALGIIPFSSISHFRRENKLLKRLLIYLFERYCILDMDN